MKTYILWQDAGGKCKYQGVVGGGLWDQFLVNARHGHGTCYLIDANDVAGAKVNAERAESTTIPNVRVFGNGAIKALNSQGGKTL